LNPTPHTLAAITEAQEARKVAQDELREFCLNDRDLASKLSR
jgi:hypothetical protein